MSPGNGLSSLREASQSLFPMTRRRFKNKTKKKKPFLKLAE
jgi:hypothetical protein